MRIKRETNPDTGREVFAWTVGEKGGYCATLADARNDATIARLGEIPEDWPSVSFPQLPQLLHLASNGSYGQRLIANRYLADWNKDHPAR